MRTLFSGIQPTGNLHIGNYIGAIKNWVELQNKYSCIYSIVDLHAMTQGLAGEQLKKNIYELAVDLLALGIDPKKSILYVQSHVPGHTELSWIFSCLTPVSELERMTQYKDKSQNQKDNINAGLLTYPVLQTADILLYKAEYVPVGHDQLQHLELARIIARKFNNKYKKYFEEIKPVLSPTPRVMSLKEPTKKMSKSLGAPHYIAIRDSEKVIREKIQKAVSDKEGVKNLLDLYSYFATPANHKKLVAAESKGKLMYSELKTKLADEIVKFLKPVHAKIKKLEANPKQVQKILGDGAKRAQKIADKNLGDIKKLIGLN